MLKLILDGKKIVVVGGAGRIGLELCRKLIAEGAEICVADIDVDPWIKFATSNYVSSEQSKVHFCEVNSTDTKSVRDLISFCKDKLTKIDGIVNCSYPRAPGLNKSVEDLSIEEFSENLRVHLGSYFLISKEFAIALKESGGGSIVNFSSIYGTVAPRFEIYEGTEMTQPIAYGAIKAGIVHSSKYLAKYLKGTQVRVNCVSPGGILDNQPDSFLRNYASHCSTKGMLEAVDIVGSVVFLLSEQSRYVNGQNIVIDDGFSL